MADFDKLWNYNKPAETEEKFRALLNKYSAENNLPLHLELLTQIARTYSLRRMFDQAHQLLDEVEGQLGEKASVAHVRYHLERGRTFNSSGKLEEAKKEFLAARETGEALRQDFYTIDAIHMLAIVAPHAEAIKLNEEGLLVAESSLHEGAKNWLGPLYNNLGWGYFDSGQYEKALSIFLRSLQWRIEAAAKAGKETTPEVFIAKWCVARTLRALNRLDEALKVQLALLEEMVKGDQPDGYVYEELGEIYLAKGEELSKMYFGFAHTELGKDEWFAKNEAARLQRMKDLSV